MNILHIGNCGIKEKSGSVIIQDRNIKLLQAIPNSIVQFFNTSMDYSWNNKLKLFLGGLNKSDEQKIIDFLKKTNVNIVFLSHSGFGRLAKLIKRKFPSVLVITFFHNIEILYARELIRVSGLRHLLFYCAARYNEKRAVNFSDFCIVLNERDGLSLEKYYNRSADCYLPSSIEDELSFYEGIEQEPASPVHQYLFVGAAFFANIQAVKWFVANVLDFVPGKLFVVGKGMKDALLNVHHPKLTVSNYVDSLIDIYRIADIVVCPVLSGGGMKTKVAEAFMFGKVVVGSKEAFEGYNIVKGAGFLCNTSAEYIKNLNDLQISLKYKFSKESRSLFETYYSFERQSKNMNTFYNDKVQLRLVD